jgi:hypothetical protein
MTIHRHDPCGFCCCTYFQDLLQRTSGLGSNWTIESGDWTIDAAGLHVSAADAKLQCNVRNPWGENDAWMEAAVNWTGSTGGPQVVFYFDNGADWIVWDFTAGSVDLYSAGTHAFSSGPGAAATSGPLTIILGSGIGNGFFGFGWPDGFTIPVLSASDLCAIGLLNPPGSGEVIFSNFILNRIGSGCSSVPGNVPNGNTALLMPALQATVAFPDPYAAYNGSYSLSLSAGNGPTSGAGWSFENADVSIGLQSNPRFGLDSWSISAAVINNGLPVVQWGSSYLNGPFWGTPPAPANIFSPYPGPPASESLASQTWGFSDPATISFSAAG